ncbi:MAG TPA: hypothetical protein PLD23_03690 [Armatimonadota bacterium]|nr:hypothetical protein [Armatimonadota bacterium]HQK92577.1 hypothetical protein [Armatimonadota bacterium]
MPIAWFMPLTAVVPLRGQPLHATGLIGIQRVDEVWRPVDAAGERLIPIGANHIGCVAGHCRAVVGVRSTSWLNRRRRAKQR